MLTRLKQRAIATFKDAQAMYVAGGSKGQAGGFKEVGSGVLSIVVISYIAITLGTALNNSNLSEMINVFTDAVIDAMPIVVVAILGLFLGMGLPKLFSALKS